MTDGHKHRLLHIGHDFDWWPVRLLRTPIKHQRTVQNGKWHKVSVSPYPYGPCENPAHNTDTGMDSTCWVLTPLGILHRWTGLTLCTWPRPCPVHDPLPDEDS